MVQPAHLWRKWALTLGLVITMAACSGPSSKKETAKDTPSSNKNPSTSKTNLQSTTGELEKTNFEIALCKLYDDKFYHAVFHHLTADLSDYEKLLERGLTSWVIQKQIEEPKAIEKINEMKFKNYCDAFIGVTRLLFEYGPINYNKQKVPYLEFARANLNSFLRASLKKLDYYSTVYRDFSSDQPLVQPANRAAAIPLLNRPDYIWRIPTALVVDPSYNGQIYEGLPPWSLITDLSGFDIKDHSFYHSQAYLQYGVEEEFISLTFKKPGDVIESKVEVETFEREKENRNSVQSHVIDNEILYLNISEISEKSQDIILSHLPDPLTDIKKYKGLILNFAGNGGGSTEFSEKIASLFLPFKSPLLRKEYIVSSTEAESAKELVTELRTHQYPNLKNIRVEDLPPVIILVSRKTASAAELITAILRANKLPMIVVGEPTFGKAIGQVFRKDHNLLDYWGYTYAAYYSFDIQEGGNVQWNTWQLDEKTGQRGIKPDIEIINPVIEDLSKNRDKVDFDNAFTMQDHKNPKSNVPVIEFSKPRTTLDEPVKILVPEEYRLQQEEVTALQEYAKILSITSCDKNAIPGNPIFSEARECLYESGLAIMKAWIELRENS